MVVGNPYVFQSNVKKLHPLVEPRKAINSIKKAVSKETGAKFEFSSHDLRRTFATYASRLDISYYKLKHLLGHSVKGDVTGAHYVQVSVEDLVPEMEKISEWLKQKCGITQSASETIITSA
jgi:integrase